MDKNRTLAFSDCVISIIITIMVLELKVPTGYDLEALRPVLLPFLSYVLSFIYIGIYWSNHHHLFHAVERVSGMALWGNLHLLFWLSLTPFVTWWMGASHFSATPVAAYGIILLLCAFAWDIERRILLRLHHKDDILRKALRSNLKEWASIAIYVIGIGMAFFNSFAACSLYTLVAVIWFIPDRRIERELGL